MQDRAVLFIRRLQNYEELRVLQRTICLRNRRKLSELALVDNSRGVWSIACNGGAFAKVFSIVWIQKQCQQLSTAKIPVWQNSIVPSDSCKAELNSAPSIRSTVAYQYYLLCIPFPRGTDRQNRTGAGKGRWGKRAGNSCYGQTGNENVQLVLHCCKKSWKAILRMLPSRNQTCLATYQVARILTHVIHRGRVTCCKTSLPWAGKTHNMCALLQNKELLSTFCQNFSQLETNSFVARQVWFLGGNMGNIAF